MKKSEKVKGKEVVVARQKRTRQYVLVVIVVMVVAAAIAFYFFNPYTVKSGDTVAVYYTGMLDDGTVFDSNVNGTPLVFTVGQGKMIFEESVLGMSPGTTKTVYLPAAKAYGTYDEALVQTVNRSSLAIENPVVGNYYSVRRTSDNAVAYIKIINMTPTTYTLDQNHELAGKDLTFTITLVEITNK
ncbi:MAG: FKBP-type peptidyl-prolyl cis-trans isomerase [Methanoregula sp.]|nr:FKBP-type peptidyl-prolyl cis-trans isomerase [Methanoregula sp.]